MKKFNVLFISNDWEVAAGAARSLADMIVALKDYVNPYVLVKYPGQVSKYYESLGIRCIFCCFIDILAPDKEGIDRILKFPRRAFTFYKWKYICIQYIKTQLTNIHIDIVHSNSSAMVIGTSLAHLLHAKHVWHVREFLDIDYHIRPLFGMNSLRNHINNADARISISKVVKEHWKLSDKNTYIIPNAVRSEKDISYIPSKDKYFLTCSAALSETKGSSFAIKAFAKSGLANKGYKLKMIGLIETEEYKKHIQRLIKEEDLEGKVELLGYQNNVRPYFEHATAFLMTSENEALGRVTIEAMFYGCPVIAKNTGGTTEFITDGETGHLFNNIEECSKLINESTILNEDIVLKAQKKAIQDFAIENYAPKILSVYQKLS